MTETDNLIAEVGRALYGERWQTNMSRDLDVADRTVRRWAAGTEHPRSGVYVDLMRLCLERAQMLDDLAARLKAMGA